MVRSESDRKMKSEYSATLVHTHVVSVWPMPDVNDYLSRAWGSTIDEAERLNQNFMG